ncbi:MAG: alkyl sulfatase dimerization domain-containing protein [Pseudomonadota bacterium]
MRAALLSAFALAACGDTEPPVPTGAAETVAPWSDAAPPVGQATPHTAAANQAVADRLALGDAASFEAAGRGFLAAIESDAIRDENGDVVWRIDAFDFLAAAAPPTANPSLWRQSQLAARHGLFEVTDGLYQVRGYDLAVMSVIRGETGWIVIDPLTVKETAAAALTLVNETLGERPVSAVLFTHSHVDHFGGARGVLSDADIAAGDIPVVAPHGFAEAAATENLIAGPHMSRRAAFMFGRTLPKSPAGHIGSGLGPGLPDGSIGLVAPTEEIPPEGGVRTIDGVRFEFLDAAGTEAPSEFIFYLPAFKALCTAEVVSGTFHNILTLRGAKARDAHLWSRVIDRMLIEYGGEAEVLFASHHWPAWGREAVRERLVRQRDIYRYVHDQTLRMANSGANPEEIAETIGEPDFLTEEFAARGYYGTLQHNAKAVFQYYFGWWDGRPASFQKHPPRARAERFVAAVGGPESALAVGKEAFREGDYRWSAEVLSDLLFSGAAPEGTAGWLAASFEQLGFQAESGAWRSYYLTAAQELRTGPPRQQPSLGNADFLKAIPSDALFDALAARYDPQAMDREPFALVFKFTDIDDVLTVEINDAVATPRPGAADAPAATIAMARRDFDRLILREASPLVMLANGRMRVEGDLGAMQAFFGALEEPDLAFPLAGP